MQHMLEHEEDTKNAPEPESVYLYTTHEVLTKVKEIRKGRMNRERV